MLDGEDEGCDRTRHARARCRHAGQGPITTLLALTRSQANWRSLRRGAAVSLLLRSTRTSLRLQRHLKALRIS